MQRNGGFVIDSSAGRLFDNCDIRNAETRRLDLHTLLRDDENPQLLFRFDKYRLNNIRSGLCPADNLYLGIDRPTLRLQWTLRKIPINRYAPGIALCDL